MVQVSRVIPRDKHGFVDAPSWLPQAIAQSPRPDQKHPLEMAFKLTSTADNPDYADGWPCLPAGLEMASILSELNASAEAMAAALLLPFILKNALTVSSIKKSAHPDVAHILEGVVHMRRVLYNDDEMSKAIDFEGLRKMLLAMINDVRVVLVRLVEQVCLMRFTKSSPDDVKQNIAKQTLAIYAPLANRLGIGQLKWELEDRAFAALYADDYKQLTQKLATRRVDRDQYIDNCVETLQSALQEAGIAAEISGRAKHLYSIWRKMQAKALPFERLFDISALRILVRDVATSYAALDVIHRLWQPLPSEFADYIATPKSNGYQSIHTVLETPEKQTIEVQIRTYGMPEASEMGVAAHWRYKDGSRHDAHFTERLAWFRTLLDWQQELADKQADFESAHSKMMDDYVYVFTPIGDVIALPVGSTPIDFAYALHTQVGHKCRGAKINGTIVPLTYPLNTGERVEIMTGNEARPSRDWLADKMGYVKSERTRAKISRWFRQQHKEAHIQRGKEALQKACQGKPYPKLVVLEKAARHHNLNSIDDLYAALGTGDIGAQGLLNAMTEKQPAQVALENDNLEKHYSKNTARIHKQDLIVHGLDNVLSHTAGCCRPVKGDEIIGFITQGQGVSVHRVACSALKGLEQSSPERLVPVSWGEQVKSAPANICIEGAQDPAMLKAVTTFLAQEDAPLLSLVSHKKRNQTMCIDVTVEVPDQSEVNRLIQRLRQIEQVYDVSRK